MECELVVTEGAGAGRVCSVTSAVVVGRARECDLVLEDPGVSRVHARVHRAGSVFVVEDVGSANGTAVNGARLDGPRPLCAGDLLALGGARLEVHLRDSRQPAARGPSFLAGVRARLGPHRRWLAGAGLFACALAAGGAFVGSRNRGCGGPFSLPGPAGDRSYGRRDAEVVCGDSVSLTVDLPGAARARLRFETLVAAPVFARVDGVPRELEPAPAGGSGELVLPPRGAPGTPWLVELGGPGSWKLARLRAEPIARLGADEAEKLLGRGLRRFDERRVAPENLYAAWLAFARVQRETEPGSPVNERAARLAGEAEAELARECARLSFAAYREETYDEDQRVAGKELLRRFPGGDPSGCRRRMEEHLPQLRDGEP